MLKINNIQREVAGREEIKELIIPTIIKNMENDYKRFGENLNEDDKIQVYEDNINLITATKIIITLDSHLTDLPKKLILFSVFSILSIDKEETNYCFHQNTFKLLGNKLINITDNDLLFNFQYK